MASILPTPSANPIALVQQISSGGTLAGTAPTDVGSTTVQSTKTWAVQAAGGLFDFLHTSGAVTIAGLELVLGGQTAYTVAITDGVTDLAANDVTLTSGTTAANVYVSYMALGATFLMPGQKIRIKTTGNASNAWRITVKGAKTASDFGLFV